MELSDTIFTEIQMDGWIAWTLKNWAELKGRE